jgi:hypothetical protein
MGQIGSRVKNMCLLFCCSLLAPLGNVGYSVHVDLESDFKTKDNVPLGKKEFYFGS